MEIGGRQAHSKLEKWMGKRKAIVLTGARQVGKTTLFNSMFAKKEGLMWLNADEAPVRERLQILSIEN